MPADLRHAAMRFGARVAWLGGARAELAVTLERATPELRAAALAGFDAVRAQMTPDEASSNFDAAREEFEKCPIPT